MEYTGTQLSRLQTPAEYQSAGRSHIFPSQTSLQWHMRQHRAELARRGALLKVAGRVLIDSQRMDEAVLALGHAAAQQESEAA